MAEAVADRSREVMVQPALLLMVAAIVLLCPRFIVAEVEQVGVKSGRPNVLFIAVDDLRTNLGCYGDKVAVTPAIDALAGRGMVFARAYAQQAVCNPSRASLMTGRRPDTIRVWDLDTHFRKTTPDVVTLPQYFKMHGYATQAIGKIYHDPQWAQDSLSWSEPEKLVVTKREGKYALPESLPGSGSKGAATERAAVDDTVYIDGQVSDAVIESLGAMNGRPFFLAVGFRRPHLPFSAPAKYWDYYNRDKLPVPETMLTSGTPKLALHESTELRGYTDIPDAGDISREQVKELVHGYYACISYTDAQIGRVLDELERLDLTSNTIVVLWSDHGYHLGEKGLWCKTTNFELDTRVPLIIADPRQGMNARTTKSIVELLDLYPTLVDLAGLPPVDGVEGVSLVPLIAGTAKEVKQAAFSQFPRPFPYKGLPKVMGYSVRTENFRYTEWRNMADGKTLERELYDHRSDPDEMINRGNDPTYDEEIARLQGLLGGKAGVRGN